MPKKDNDSGGQPPFDPTSLRILMERTLAGVGPKSLNNESLAQDLAFEAMSSTNLLQSQRFMARALAQDPTCVDALVMLVEISIFDPEERVEAFRGIVATGEKKLGKGAIKKLAPHTWGYMPARPYMRARSALANALRDAGKAVEAAQEFAEMLLLNESDNQGVRYGLLTLLLADNLLVEARALMDRFTFDCEFSVVFAWGRVLERLLSGEEADAIEFLALARKQNAHMEAFLLGHRKPPKNLPPSYQIGSKEEAACFADTLTTAWKPHPKALKWLLIQRKA